MKLLVVVLFAMFIGCRSSAYGEIVFFDVSDNAGTAGEGLENFGFFTASGVTITVSTFSACNSNSAFPANGSRGGVDNNEVDEDEILTFTFTFANPFATLNFIDLQGIGNSLSDAAFVDIHGVVECSSIFMFAAAIAVSNRRRLRISSKSECRESISPRNLHESANPNSRISSPVRGRRGKSGQGEGWRLLDH